MMMEAEALDTASYPRPTILADEIAMKDAGRVMLKGSDGSINFLCDQDVDERVEINALPQMACNSRNETAEDRQREAYKIV